MTVPLVVVIGLALGGAGGNDGGSSPSSAAPLPAVTVTPPPATDDRTVGECAQVISALPLVLAGQDLRRVVSNPPTGSVQAWGDPPIVLRCGVAKPKALNPSLVDGLVQVNGALLLRQRAGDDGVWTVVDRAVFVELSVPTSYGQPPLGPVVHAVTQVLPRPVCVEDATQPRSRQCTRR